jgi:hypothetical protein
VSSWLGGQLRPTQGYSEEGPEFSPSGRAFFVGSTPYQRLYVGILRARLERKGIPQAGRIVSVVDTFGALTHARPYNRTSTIGEAVREISRVSDTQFDPRVVDVFLSVVEAKDLVATGSR